MYIRAKNDLGVWSVIDVDTLNIGGPIVAQPISFVGPDTVCFPNTITMIADSAAGVNYQWLESGVPIPGATYATYVTDTSGTFSLQQTCLGTTVTSNALIAIVNYLP
jgi:hypothetical protein